MLTQVVTILAPTWPVHPMKYESQVTKNIFPCILNVLERWSYIWQLKNQCRLPYMCAILISSYDAVGILSVLIICVGCVISVVVAFKLSFWCWYIFCVVLSVISGGIGVFCCIVCMKTIGFSISLGLDESVFHTRPYSLNI